jgi:GLPGLI family protein
MLKILSILTVFVFYINSFSQDMKGIVYYGQLESMGMKAPIGHDYSSVLVFTKNQSSYITKNDSLEKGHVYENNIIEKGSEYFARTKATNKYGFRYFFDLTKDSLYSRDLGFQYVQEKLPKIDWTITSETQKIGIFVCTKATAEFRGRNYTAWFTTEIPLPYGPWKLHGLPGLILEAYDTKKEVFFYFKSLEYPTKTLLKVEKPVIQIEQKGKKWITFDEYKKNSIESYLKAINNGRVFMESSNVATEENNKKLSMDSRIENFDIDEFTKKD